MAAKEGSFERKKQEGWLGLWNHPPFREICLRRREGERRRPAANLRREELKGELLSSSILERSLKSAYERGREGLSLVNRSAKSWIRNAECSDRQNKLVKPLPGFRGIPFPSPSERVCAFAFSWKRTSKADRRNDHRAQASTIVTSPSSPNVRCAALTLHLFLLGFSPIVQFAFLPHPS